MAVLEREYTVGSTASVGAGLPEAGVELGVTARYGAGPFLTELVVRIGLRDVVVSVADIDWVEAESYLARLHVGGRAYLIRERMHVLEQRLDPREFARVHRSAIVNMRRVAEVRRNGRERVLTLVTGARLRASRRGWSDFKAALRRRT